VSASDPNSESADKPAELAPDEPTAVHDVPSESVPAQPADEPTVTRDVPGAGAGDATVIRDIPVVPGLGEPSAAEEVTPTPEPPAAPEPPVAPGPLVAPPAAPLPPALASETPSAPAPGAFDASPQLTSSGLPNPHGLPEIAVERPEVAVGAAFAGGLAFALILKRLAR
jgi:hypothetical protein